MHLELRAKQLSPSLFAACMLSCIAPICAMHHTLQRYVDCVHPSGKIANHVLHVLFVATMYAVCLILYRYVCL